MPLKFSPSVLSSAIDKGRGDYVVCSGDWDVGRIYETPDSPDHLRWLVDERQRSDDALRPHADLGGG
jgi:hypothetical protein